MKKKIFISISTLLLTFLAASCGSEVQRQADSSPTVTYGTYNLRYKHCRRGADDITWVCSDKCVGGWFGCKTYESDAVCNSALFALTAPKGQTYSNKRCVKVK